MSESHGASPLHDAVAAKCDAIRKGVADVVVGYDGAVEEVLVALLCEGHVLLEGVPGVAKTLLARTIAALTGLEFRRIQFTPDLTPADATGTNIFDLRSEAFRLQKGPVFTNVLLADEINRTSPKTQSSLLEAMEERQVTIDGESHRLPSPFFVIATQNPMEHEGTYPLPEAQLDRFTLKVMLGYPEADDEIEIYRRMASGVLSLTGTRRSPERVVEADDWSRFREAMRETHIEERVLRYAHGIVRATRDSDALLLGASPRAGMTLLATARARALLEGRGFVIPDDVKRLARPVLAHRLIPTPDAELAGRFPPDILDELVELVDVPR